MTKLEEIVAEFRNKLSDCGSKFLLVYTEDNLVTEKQDCRITSNSSQQGVRAILTFLLRPTDEAITVIQRALEDVARASGGILPSAINEAIEAGTFHTAAGALFEQIRTRLTLVGWEQLTPSDVKAS